MKGNWLKTLVAGVAIACLAIPLTAMGATQADSALKTGKTGHKGSVATSEQRAQRKALHEKKFALLKERGELAKQGDRAALDANSAQIDSVDAQLKHTKNGGAK